MIDFFFVDDSRQDRASRPGMGPLVCAGMVSVPGEQLASLERALGTLCQEAGFPADETGEFKWSPGRELWMRDHLHGEDRDQFLESALEAAAEHDVSVTVVVCDTSRASATGAASPDLDATKLLLERADWHLEHRGRSGVVVADRPSGDRRAETKFLGECLETVIEGTEYRPMDRLAVNVLSTPSKMVRCLQLADLCTGCTLSVVAGEATYGPRVFQHIRPLLTRRGGRVGGVGLKIHPHGRYMNLYHWILNEDTLWTRGVGVPIPRERRPYYEGPMVP